MCDEEELFQVKSMGQEPVSAGGIGVHVPRSDAPSELKSVIELSGAADVEGGYVGEASEPPWLSGDGWASVVVAASAEPESKHR